MGFQFLSFCMGLKLNLDQSRKLAATQAAAAAAAAAATGASNEDGVAPTSPNWKRVKEELSSNLHTNKFVERKHSYSSESRLAEEAARHRGEEKDELFSRRAARLATPRKKGS